MLNNKNKIKYMRVSVCGVKNNELLKKVERHYKVESVATNGSIYELAKVTYDHDDKKNAVFDGCVLDCTTNNIHPFDEQIVLCALDNLDVVYVYTNGMSAEEVDNYHQYDEFYPGRVIDVNSVDTFVIK